MHSVFLGKDVVNNIISLCVCESKICLIVIESAEQLATVAHRPPQLEPTHGKVRFRDLMSTALWVGTHRPVSCGVPFAIVLMLCFPEV